MVAALELLEVESTKNLGNITIDEDDDINHVTKINKSS